MRVLAIYRHYWPDTPPYARLLRAILEHLGAEGHIATVYTAQPSYNDIKHAHQLARESLNGVDIIRLRLLPERKHLAALRIINHCYFLIRAVLHVLMAQKYDVVIANTHPPVIIGVALRVVKAIRGIPYILHCQDIHPESAAMAGQLNNSAVYRFMRAIDAANCIQAKAIVTLSSDMRNTLIARDAAASTSIKIINNFPLDVYNSAWNVPRLFHDVKEAPFRVLFAGNMGLFQNLESFVEAARHFKDVPQIQFVFMGAGAARNKLKERAGELVGRTVFFEDFQPVETAFECMKRSDLGVVSLAKDIYRVAYPSKTMTYLAAGCPVLALVERESGLADEIIDNEFGYVPESLAVVDIIRQIDFAFMNRKAWSETARKLLTVRSNSHFGKENALSKWSQLFDEISGVEHSPQELNPPSALKCSHDKNAA